MHASDILNLKHGVGEHALSVVVNTVGTADNFSVCVNSSFPLVCLFVMSPLMLRHDIDTAAVTY